jgi:hypothetical protein
MIGGKYSGEGSFPILHLVFPPNPHIASCEFACVPDTETLKKHYRNITDNVENNEKTLLSLWHS